MNLCFTLLVLGSIIIHGGHSQRKSNSEGSIHYDNVIDQNGYHFKYKTADAERIEQGVLSGNQGEETLTVSGSYSFVAADGKTYEVVFVADENGYHPKVKTGVVQKPQRPFVQVQIGSDALKTLSGGGLG